MYKLIDDTNYSAFIESVETKHTSASTTVAVIRGWAIDKFRKTAMTVTVEDPHVTVKQMERGDVADVFELDHHEPAGFRIETASQDRRITLRLSGPGTSVEKNIDVANVRRMLRMQGMKTRARRWTSYALNVWHPSGFRAVADVVRRRVVTGDPGYNMWIKRHETMNRRDAEALQRGFARRPLISIVTPVYNVEEQWLRRLVQSMKDQWYPNWELCLADDCSPAPHIKPLLEELAREDPRIKVVFRTENGRIAKATNSAIELACGEYVGFMDNDDELPPQALFEVVRAVNKRPDIDFIYTDEDKINEQGVRFDPFFKPGFSPMLLLGHNYITHFVVVSRGLLDKVGYLRAEYDGSQDYDFVLRATEQARCVHHIPQILYHWRTLDSSVAGDPRSKMYAYTAGQRALEDAMRRRGIDAVVTMLDNYGTYKIDCRFDQPKVTVVVSSYTDEQLDHLRRMTDYPCAEFIRSSSFDSERVDTEYVMLLDGLMPQASDWLREMVNYGRFPGVGIVGGKTFDRNDRVLNAGLTLRAMRTSQPFEMRGKWDEGIGYYFRDILPREMFAVTEDCMLIPLEDYRKLHGPDKTLPAGMRGVDICVRERAQLKKRVVWQPYSAFVDIKANPIALDKADIVDYVSQHLGLTDPYAAAAFPYAQQEQPGLAYSIDSVDWEDGSGQYRIIGWAADLHSRDVPELSLVKNGWAHLDSLERTLRPDVNARFNLPGDRMYGFVVFVSVDDTVMESGDHTLKFRMVTATDRKIAKVHVSSTRMGRRLSDAMGKARVLRYPRSTFFRLKDRFMKGRWQTIRYRRLVAKTERFDADAIAREIADMQYKPLISLLVPVYNVEPRWLRRCVESVRQQFYPNWELCLADDCSTDPRVRATLEELVAQDSRIKVVFREKNGHISRATNSALEIAVGEFIGLLDNDDELPPHALYEVVKVLNADNGLDLIYTDEDKIDEQGKRFSPHFKPDYSPDLLLSTNYISHFGVYRKSIVDEIGGLRVGYEGSQDYDLVLRFVEHTTRDRICHIPKVLYHWRTLATSTASSGNAKSYTSDAGLRALRSAMDRRGIPAEVHLEGPNGIYDVEYDIAEPALVSVIIPTKNGYDNIERCLNSIIEKTTYENYEIIIADNGSTNEKMFDLYDRYRERLGDRFHVEEIDIPFNFSRINNLAAQKAQGRYLLFMNDDTEVIMPDWMRTMVSFCQLERVGVVGAKLYYPDNTIQHAGIVLGLTGVAGHIQVGFPRGDFGYFGRLIENVNYSAVTAACCMVKAEDFRAVDGFDEDLAVAYNDVDLCIRIGRLGRDIVWAHEAELYHFESVTRGYDVKNERKKARLQTEAKKLYARYTDLIDNDPYYNPNLSRTSGNYWVRKV